MFFNLLPKALSKSDAAFFDNDGVTYSITQKILDEYAIAVAKAAKTLIPELTLEEGVRLAWKSWYKYKYSLQIFGELYGVDLNEMHVLYHRNCDVGIIPVDKILSSYFESFTLPRYMITHGGREWTYRILDHLNIRKFFPDEHIYALEDVGFQKKSDSPAPFEYVLSREGYRPERSILIEDSITNIEHAKALGMTTVLITNGKYMHPHPDVDFMFGNLKDFLYAASGAQPVRASNNKIPSCGYSIPTTDLR